MAYISLPWHEGEEHVQRLLHVPRRDNPTTPYLSPGAGFLVQQAPLLALGALDTKGRPWSTIWGGTEGFAGPVADSSIALQTQVDTEYDPVARALLANGEGYADTDQGKMVSGLAIDLEHRRRVKLYGRMKSGSIYTDQAQLVVHIEESMGNCPKYLNKRRIVPAQPDPKLLSDQPQLTPAAVELLSRADTVFVSSRGTSTMDTNIRGGPAGFVRLQSNESSGAVLVYPEYSGNRLYQTLGNLQITPLAGYVVPDFENGNVLYLTGRTELLVGKEASDVLPRSNLAVRVTVDAAVFVQNGLAFRGHTGELSPYNPSVRYHVCEKQIPNVQANNTDATATLIKKEIITPSIQRFRFRISSPTPQSWTAGQYATLSFEEELNMGYSHMRDDDPTSLNDDFVRTFTISSYPADHEFEMMIRRNGPVTNYLFRVAERAALSVPLKGFGGSFRITTSGLTPFIAGGIGITPLLAQLHDLDISLLRLYWSIGIDDIGLVQDTFRTWPALASSTTLFLTGVGPDRRDGMSATVVCRRMRAGDLDVVAERWYLCAGVALKGMVLNWLSGKEVVYEDFNY